MRTATGSYEIQVQAASIKDSEGRRTAARPAGQPRRDGRCHCGRCGVGHAVIGLDTNVVVRYLAQDAPEQSAIASTLIDEMTETDPGFLSLVTVVEVYWVLRRAYKMSSARCDEVLHGLLNARELRLGHGHVLRNALAGSGGEVDFADAVIAECSAGSQDATTRRRSTGAPRSTRTCNSLDLSHRTASSDAEASNSTPAPSAE
jgi:predicted nucleic-acid-binding protein